MCCKMGQHNEMCGAAVKPTDVCKVGSDYSPDAITQYDCEKQMSEADCTGKNGDEYSGQWPRCRVKPNVCPIGARWVK